MEKMTAKFDEKHAYNAINLGTKKELIKCCSLVSDSLDELITVRWYSGRNKYASTITCSLWIHGDHYCSGTGKAGGFGYDKLSASFSDACDSAGITLSRNIHGVGEGAIREAMDAIAEECGITKYVIVGHS